MIIGGTNLTNVQYTDIGNQIKFIDTIKHYQQAPSALASSVDKTEKESIRKSMTMFLKKHNYFWDVFHALTDENKHRVLRYLCEGKGVISYEKNRCYSDLEARPVKGKFYEKTEFYCSVKNEIISENVKRFYELMRMTNLSNLNDIYNMQDIHTSLRDT